MQVNSEEIQSRKPVKQRTGEILLEMGLITPQQLEEALDEQKHTHLRIGEVLLQRGWIKGAELTKALARRLGVQFLDLEEMRVDPSAAGLITDKDARRYAAIPVAYVNDHTLLVAMVNPSNVFALDDLRIMTGYDIEAAIATEEDVFAQISKLRRRTCGHCVRGHGRRDAGYPGADRRGSHRQACEQHPGAGGR
jgi:type IV pilus assembly protein PilB